MLSNSQLCDSERSFCLRGNHSDIIDHKMVPDYPDVYSWTIDRVECVADTGVD